MRSLSGIRNRKSNRALHPRAAYEISGGGVSANDRWTEAT